MSVELTLALSHRSDLPVYEIEPLRRLGVDAFLTGRLGGVSEGPYDSLNLGDHVGDEPDHVGENRRRVAAAVRVAPDKLLIARQVHGAVVHSLNAPLHDLVGDALVTSNPNLAVAVLVADCLPIALCDDDGRVAVVHAGWRGLQAGVIRAAVNQFDEELALTAFIGPRISAAGYQVGPEVAEQFASIEGAVLPDEGDRSRLDLVAVALAQLRRAGVRADTTYVSTQVTDGGTAFFSDRAQRPCGRFGLVLRGTSYDGSVESRA